MVLYCTPFVVLLNMHAPSQILTTRCNADIYTHTHKTIQFDAIKDAVHCWMLFYQPKWSNGIWCRPPHGCQLLIDNELYFNSNWNESFVCLRNWHTSHCSQVSFILPMVLILLYDYCCICIFDLIDNFCGKFSHCHCQIRSFYYCTL